MNKEIKFRVWNAKDHWYFPEKETPSLRANGTFDSELGFYNELIVEQYTGLKDKNGKEVYRGDILKIFYQSGDFAYSDMSEEESQREDEIRGEYIVEVVAHLQESCNLNLKGKFEEFPITFPLSYTSGGEIIGNIHENPDLLK